MAPVSAIVYAKDLDVVRTFYAELLTLAAVDGSDDDVICLGDADGDARVTIVAIPSGMASSIEISTPPERRDQVALKHCFEVESIERARRLAARLGGAVDAPEAEWPWRGLVHCDGVDPEGNIFQLQAPPESTGSL